MLSALFYTFFYQPLFNLLILICAYLPGHDLGLSIIILTILVRILLYPLFVKSIRAQESMNALQPKIQEVRKKYKKDPARQSKELMALYQSHHVNPFMSILLLLIQLPILIALYQVFRGGFEATLITKSLYPFVQAPVIHSTFFGLLNLAKPSFLLAIVTAIAQYFQSKMLMRKTPSSKSKTSVSAMAQKSMLYILPLFTFLFLTSLNAAIGLYWITTTVFTIGQQYIVAHPFRHHKSS